MAAICARIESAKRCGDAGWLHRLREDDDWQQPQRRTVRVATAAPATRPDLATLAERCAVGMRPDVLRRLAESLGLSVESLRWLRVGWSAEHRATTWPMTDASGNVLGIRLRRPSGHKLSVGGDKQGLFIPTTLDAGGVLLVAEGPTDTAALVDLGYSAVGRPSCNGGVKLITELVKQWRPLGVVVVADADAPGQRGAESLAAVLVAYSRCVRVIEPPTGIKDAREWKRSGATRADVEAAIDAAPVRRLAIHTRKVGNHARG